MHSNKNGYVGGAVLFERYIKQLRDHVEYEKFLCRVLRDDETTQKFKAKTEAHKNRIYAFRYNNEKANRLTAAGKKNASQPTTA